MGLAMSRSLGDLAAHSAGVSSDPEVAEYALTSADQLLILATDGIWDVLDCQQAVHLAQTHISRSPGGLHGDWDPREVAAVLCRTARKRWESMSAMVDDITAVVVRLRPSTRAGAGAE